MTTDVEIATPQLTIVKQTFGCPNVDVSTTNVTISPETVEIDQLTKRYLAAKRQPAGTLFFCAMCGCRSVKSFSLQTFCTSSENDNCENQYWNAVTPTE